MRGRRGGEVHRTKRIANTRAGTLIFSRLAWEHLVSYGMFDPNKTPISCAGRGIDLRSLQLGQGSAHRTTCCDQEDYEALQHSGLV